MCILEAGEKSSREKLASCEGRTVLANPSGTRLGAGTKQTQSGMESGGPGDTILKRT